MMATRRRPLLAGLVLAAVGVAGCDLGTLAWLLTPEQKELPEIRKLASDDKKKDVKALILTFAALDLHQNELVGADRELAVLLARQLRELCEANGERLTVVPPGKVEDYKSTRPNWRNDADPVAVGRHFGADYVIVVDLRSLSLYEKGSFDMLYHAHADLSVTLFDVRHPDDSPDGRDLILQYPSEANLKLPDPETPPARFRTQFLSYVAKRVAWHFTAHPKREGLYVD
jgi:hypothetical protein